ncbi:MAG: murein transglycosylase A [Desulfatirhabdiaceae bacterium]
MIRLQPSDYPVFQDDLNGDGLLAGIENSLTYLHKLASGKTLVFGPDSYPVSHVIESLKVFRDFMADNPSAETISKFITNRYRVYRSTGREQDGRVLFTGYYEPFLKGSLDPDDRYSCPIYEIPDDLVTVDLSLFSDKFKGEKITGRLSGKTVVPYWDRIEIENSDVVRKKARVLAWVDDPVDLFFLQIQGSGKILLDTGPVVNVHYHASNGRPYRSIGTLMIEKGMIPKPEMSMQRIREYLKAHPDQVAEILNYNPSYVFFKEEPDGPIGSIGAPLTPGRSVAVDRRIFPPTSLVFIQTQKPVVDQDQHITSWESFSRFALNQDTGGAIVGPGRTDIFWGNGPYAEVAAGHLQHAGNLYFLVLKP